MGAKNTKLFFREPLVDLRCLAGLSACFARSSQYGRQWNETMGIIALRCILSPSPVASPVLLIGEAFGVCFDRCHLTAAVVTYDFGE